MEQQTVGNFGLAGFRLPGGGYLVGIRGPVRAVMGN